MVKDFRWLICLDLVLIWAGLRISKICWFQSCSRTENVIEAGLGPWISDLEDLANRLSLLPVASTHKKIRVQVKNSIVLNDTNDFRDLWWNDEKKCNSSFFPGQKSYADVMKIETLWLVLTAITKNKIDEQVYGHKKLIESDECDH